MQEMINYLKRALDGAGARQRAIGNNIANVNTPGYKRKDVNFTQILQDNIDQKQKVKLQRTDKDHRESKESFTELSVNSADKTKYKNDRNNVDIDVEMAEMAKNQIYYNTISQQLNNRLQLLRNVIDKGGR